MIELLLGADQLLAAGELDRAERIYRQVAEADPRNAIATVGLARVADARGQRDAALALAERALSIDPDDQAAQLLVAEFEARSSAPPDGTALGPSAPVRRSICDRARALLRFGR